MNYRGVAFLTELPLRVVDPQLGEGKQTHFLWDFKNAKPITGSTGLGKHKLGKPFLGCEWREGGGTEDPPAYRGRFSPIRVHASRPQALRAVMFLCRDILVLEETDTQKFPILVP